MAGIDPLKRITLLYHFHRPPQPPVHPGAWRSLSHDETQEQKIEVPAPGGNEWSQDADGMKGMDGYVHVCFRNNHPMEYLAREEGRIGDTIFLQIHPDVLTWDGVLFTDGRGKQGRGGNPYHRGAREIIDFEVLYTRTNWSDPQIQGPASAGGKIRDSGAEENSPGDDKESAEWLSAPSSYRYTEARSW